MSKTAGHSFFLFFLKLRQPISSHDERQGKKRVDLVQETATNTGWIATTMPLRKIEKGEEMNGKGSLLWLYFQVCWDINS